MDEVTPRVAKSLRCRSVLVPALCLLAFASTRDAVAQQVNLRSIGSPGFYAIGTVSVTNGSPNVTGLGTAWLTANRGRGDVITIPCSSAPVCPGGTSYTVASVSAEGALQLTQPFAGVSGGASYAIQRQFTTLAAWEDCVNGPPGGGCGFFPVLSSSLVADGRSEVGIAYKDSVFTLAGPVDIDGSITDATHTITLTADGANRHLGLAGTGVVLNNGVNGGPALRVRDDHVTVEWLEITNGQGAGAHPIQADNQAPANGLVFRNLLLHDAGGNGIEIRDSDTIADLYDNIVYKTINGGISLANGTFAGSIRILNNTVFNCFPSTGIASSAAVNTTVTLRNNIAISNAGDYAVPLSIGASSNNLSGDATAPGTSPSLNKPLPQLAFFSTTAGFENLHIGSASAAIGVGADLSPIFTTDIDGQTRLPAWDLGADETLGGVANLSVTKTDSQVSAVPGTSITYVITVTNAGPDTLTSLFVNDALPAVITGPAFSPSTGSYDSGTGEWTGLNLAASQSVTLTLSGTIDPFARGTIANGVAVSQPAGFTGSTDSTVDTDSLDPVADVQITKTDDVDPVALGGLLTYTLSVGNNGPSGATSLSLQDPLPASVTLDAAAGAITPSQGTCNYLIPSRTVSCALGDLVPGSFAVVTVKVRPQALGSVVNTASVGHAEPDNVAGNDSESETTSVVTSTLDVRYLTATSTSQRNVLEWLNPTDANYLSTEIVVKGGSFPTAPGDGFTLYNAGASGARDKLVHNAGGLSNGVVFYYAAFVHRAVAPLVSAGRFVTGRPFDHVPGPVKWAFSTGATALAAPTVGSAGVIATSNDQVVYAMERGTDDDHVGVDSGEWPASFVPIALGGPAQARSPVVPVTAGTASSVVYLGGQDGKLYVVDAVHGSSVGGFPVGPTVVGPMLQAAPAGIFAAFGGTRDYLLIGTRDGSGPNAFAALNPYTGALVDSYNNGGAGAGAIGIVNGMAVVDYDLPQPPRVYFTSHAGQPVGSTNTLWCFELPAAAPIFSSSLSWVRQLGDIDSSPVLRGGRLYVGGPQLGGTVYSLNSLTGFDDRIFTHGNGQVKGFVFPDRASNDLYFATDDSVWGVTDNGVTIANKFAGPINLPGGARPSPVLFVPGSHYVYVGGSDGMLYEIDVLPAVPVVKSVQLGDGLAAVGAPSLDRGFNLVHVGTEAGIFYAVQVPLP